MAESVMDEIHVLVEKGHWLRAIKIYNDYFKTGLKQAKKYIDELRRHIRNSLLPCARCGVPCYTDTSKPPAVQTAEQVFRGTAVMEVICGNCISENRYK